MNAFPPPTIVTALAAFIALPFSVAAAGTLFLTAGLGSIIHLDYVQRQRRLRLPRTSGVRRCTRALAPFCGEAPQLAA
jgi:hypothetical protein